MSSFDRRMFLIGLAGVAGCGFTPAYAPGGAAEGLRGQIAIDPPKDEEGYIFVRQMEDRLGTPQAAAYDLSASLRIARDALAVTPDQETTRYQMQGQLAYTLTERATDTAVATGTLSNFTSYSAPVFGDTRGSIAGNTVTVLTAERDARRRLMVILADQLVSRLVATAPSWRT